MTDQEIIQRACDFYGVSLHDFDARNGKKGKAANTKGGQENAQLPVKARRLACRVFLLLGYTKCEAAKLVGYSGPTSVRLLLKVS